MGHYRVEPSSRPGILLVELSGAISVEELRALANDYSTVVDALNGAPFRVFCDLSHMQPLSPEAAAFFQSVKTTSGMRSNFEGSAVLVSSSLVAMQHRRTSHEAGVLETELISDDEAACWEHLRRVQRSRR